MKHRESGVRARVDRWVDVIRALEHMADRALSDAALLALTAMSGMVLAVLLSVSILDRPTHIQPPVRYHYETSYFEMGNG